MGWANKKFWSVYQNKGHSGTKLNSCSSLRKTWSLFVLLKNIRWSSSWKTFAVVWVTFIAYWRTFCARGTNLLNVNRSAIAESMAVSRFSLNNNAATLWNTWENLHMLYLCSSLRWEWGTEHPPLPASQPRLRLTKCSEQASMEGQRLLWQSLAKQSIVNHLFSCFSFCLLGIICDQIVVMSQLSLQNPFINAV